jgi:hypothetical protein
LPDYEEQPPWLWRCPCPQSEFKDVIVAMTFGVAILSLVVQAEALQVYVKRVKL